MTKATYTYTNKAGKKHTCFVTLSNEGKTSISISIWSKWASGSERFMAKKLGKQIVEADFKHEAITELIIEDTKGLVALLKSKTEDLYREFMMQTSDYAEKQFVLAEKTAALTGKELVERYGERKLRFPQSHHERINGEFKTITTTHVLSEFGESESNKAKDIVKMGFSAFLAKELKNANEHFSDSLQNLASRLNAKGVTIEKEIVIISKAIGVNFEMEITCGSETMKAWTIIASGPVQRPHYRFYVN